MHRCVVLNMRSPRTRLLLSAWVTVYATERLPSDWPAVDAGYTGPMLPGALLPYSHDDELRQAGKSNTKDQVAMLAVLRVLALPGSPYQRQHGLLQHADLPPSVFCRRRYSKISGSASDSMTCSSGCLLTHKPAVYDKALLTLARTGR